jgi:cob(I)alamin adenosyltransferase
MANKFFTNKGDDGKVRIGNKVYSKNDAIFYALGDLDELNSLIGLAKNYLGKNLNKKLFQIQEDLFLIQAILAERYFLKNFKRNFPEERILNLEKEIEKIEKIVEPINKFIIPGSNKNSAWLDYLRSIARRVERSLIFLDSKKKILPNEIIAYINRLSSYFYTLARLSAHQKKIKEPNPRY